VKTGDSDDLELRLYPESWDEAGGLRRREAALASVVLHALGIAVLAASAHWFPPPQRTGTAELQEHVSLVYPPLRELTQKAPNLQPPSKLFLGPPEPVRPPRLVLPQPGRGETMPQARQKGSPKVLEERPPQLTPRPDPQGTQLAQILPPIAAAAPPPPAPPKLVLEDAHRSARGSPGDVQVGELLPQRPGNVMEGTVRDLSRNPGVGGTVVGDGVGGVPGGFIQPSPGNAGSNLELLSDPLGVDFRPYLTRILSTVRRNWYAVIPESARLGMTRGRVVIQMAILRQGSVSKLVIAGPSGQGALDRAAVAGISASDPFPPLPAEFRGDQIRLQFTFLYNIPVR
jgi:TonB family protein